MTTKKPGFNITMEPHEEKFLISLAKKEHKSISSLIRELILESLERREDMALSELADRRLEESGETVSHEDVWKDLLKKDS